MDYFAAARSIIKTIGKQTTKPLKQNEVIEMLKNEYTNLRGIDNGLTPAEKEEKAVQAVKDTILEICKNSRYVENVSDAIKDEDELP
jgi:hypothetical protein